MQKKQFNINSSFEEIELSNEECDEIDEICNKNNKCSYCDFKYDKTEEYFKHLNKSHYSCWKCNTITNIKDNEEYYCERCDKE